MYSDIIALNRSGEANTMTVFPNPVKDMVNVVFTASDQRRKLLITDARGAIVKTIVVPAGVTNIRTDMSVFAKGIYTVSLDDGVKKLVKGVIKQ